MSLFTAEPITPKLELAGSHDASPPRSLGGRASTLRLALILPLTLAVLAGLTAYLLRRLGAAWTSSSLILSLFWAADFAVTALNPLRLPEMTDYSAFLQGVAFSSLSIGLLLATSLRRVPRSPGRTSGSTLRNLSASARRRLNFVALFTTVAAVYGMIAFRSAVEAAAGGRPYASLSARDVRYYQVYGDLRSQGFAFLCFGLTPLIASIGVVLLASQRRRSGLLWIFSSLAIAAQNPGRSLFFATAAIAAVMWLRSDHISSSVRRASSRRWLTGGRAVALILIGVALTAYFIRQGDRLKKNEELQRTLGGSGLSASVLAQPTLYLTGSPAALSVALSTHTDPTDRVPLRSLWIVPRLASLLWPDVKTPETVASPVNIGVMFNTYGWVGDIYFDLGLPGLVVLPLLAGVAMVQLDAFALRSRTRVAAQFGAALFLTTLLAGVLVFSLFWLSTIFVAAVGTLLLSWAQHSNYRCQQISQAPELAGRRR